MLKGKYEISDMKIKGYDVIEARLNDTIVFQSFNDYYVQYTVTEKDSPLSESDAINLKFTLYGSEHSDYKRLVITLKNGSTTTDLNTNMNDIAYITVWYHKMTESINFNSSKDLTSIKYMNINKFKSFDNMFNGCSNLMEINTTGWEGCTGLLSMKSVFQNCINLTGIDLSNLKTDNVTNMSHLFYNCTSLKAVNMKNCKLSKVAWANYMFHECTELTTLEGTRNWYLGENLYYAENMFYNCKSLEEIDVYNWRLTNISSMKNMFYNCQSVKVLDCKYWNVGYSSPVSVLDGVFYNCRSVQELNLKNWDVSKTYSMKQLFTNCLSLSSIDLSTWDTSRVSYCSDMFKLVPMFVNWNMGTSSYNNYSKFTLNETQTGFSGRFPWRNY